jgi:AcrR family transcriptional regulator
VLCVHVPDLQPESDPLSRRDRRTAADLQKAVAQEEHQSGRVGVTELAVDGETERVSVEPLAASGVCGAQKDAAAENLHEPHLAHQLVPVDPVAPGDFLTSALAGLIVLLMLDTPNRDRIAKRREATRREIVDAAWALAQEQGLTEFTLRDVAQRVGMRAPSLYTHFESKHAIYDAMFGQAWSDYEQLALAEFADLPGSPRAAIRRAARMFFDFAVADPARHQLMNQRTIPGFEPTPEAYAPAVRVLEQGRRLFTDRGLTASADYDIWVAMISGLINQQLANDPGGARWSALLERAIEIWADGVGIPPDPPPQAGGAHTGRPRDNGVRP